MRFINTELSVTSKLRLKKCWELRESNPGYLGLEARMLAAGLRCRPKGEKPYLVLSLLEDPFTASGDVSVAAGVGDVAVGSEGGVGPVFVLLSSAAFQLKLEIKTVLVLESQQRSLSKLFGSAGMDRVSLNI